MNGMLVRNQDLYFGSASEGKIFKFGDTDNDNGAAIEAYWKSKDFFMGEPFNDKDFVNIGVIAGSVADSSMTVTHTVNGSSETSYTMPLYTSNSSFTRNNRNLVAGRAGNTLSLQFGNDAADQPFEVFGGAVGYRRKTWIPTP
jgi:hypothetical protein